MNEALDKVFGGFQFTAACTALMVAVGLHDLYFSQVKWLSAIVIVLLAICYLCADLRERKATECIAEMVADAEEAKTIIEDVVIEDVVKEKGQPQ